MNIVERPKTALAHKVRRLGHLDLAGAGQVTVAGNHAYVGHIPSASQLGTSIIDISNPREPRVVATITLDDPTSHSHKARVAEELKRQPTTEEIAAKLSVTVDDVRALEAYEQRGYQNGGFKIYDVSNPAQPKLICYQKTGGIGVHRFDMDERYAYISTEMPGYIGNILVIYDLADPSRPREVSRWSMPGQHVGR